MPSEIFSDSEHQEVAQEFVIVSRINGSLVGLIGLLTLAGWVFNIAFLRCPIGTVPLKGNSAISLSVLGLVLVALSINSARLRLIATGLLIVPGSISFLTTVEYLFGVDLRIDQLLWRDPVSVYSPPGRMGIAAAFGILFASIALATLHYKPHHRVTMSNVAALGTFVAGFLSTVDYALDWRPSFSGVSVQMAVALLLLGVGALSVRPTLGLMRNITSMYAGGAAARRVIPYVLVIPLTLGVFSGITFHFGLHDMERGCGLLITGIVGLLLTSIVWNADQMNGMDEQRIAERRRATDELRSSNRALRTLSRCSQVLVHALSEEALLRDICAVVVEGGYRLAWVGMADDKLTKQIRVAASAGIEAQYVNSIAITWDDSELGRGPTGTAIRTGTVCIGRDLATNPSFAPWREAGLQHGFAASCVFPLKHNGEVFAALSIYSEANDAFSENDVALLQQLADDLAYGIVSLRARAEHARSEAELRLSRQRLDLALHAARAGTFDWDIQKNVNAWSRQTEEIYGVAPGQFGSTFESWKQLIFPEDFDKTEPAIRKALESGEFRGEWRVRRPSDGQVRWIAARAKVYFDDERRPLHMIGVNYDITERKEAEAKLRQQAALLDLAHDAIVVRDFESRVLFWSRGAEETYGYTSSEASGRILKDLLHAVFPVPIQQIMKEIERRGEWQGESQHTSRNGQTIIVASRWSLLRDESGSPTAVLEINRDITSKVKAERELEARTLELQRSNSELQDFASIASHDLQEPLRKVLAFGDRLRERSSDNLDEISLDYLKRMQSAASRMSGLVESLLDYSRVTTKAQPFATVDLSKVLSEVLLDLEARVQSSGAEVSFGTLPTIVADKLQVRQLLQNLLANAMKFHKPDEPPRIEVTCDFVEGKWRLIVRDHGIGFEQAYADRIFRPFQRLHARTEFEGSGMGLAICRKIATRHGGSIEAQSSVGNGATFVVTLPEHPGNESVDPRDIALQGEMPHELASPAVGSYSGR